MCRSLKSRKQLLSSPPRECGICAACPDCACMHVCVHVSVELQVQVLAVGIFFALTYFWKEERQER